MSVDSLPRLKTDVLSRMPEDEMYESPDINEVVLTEPGLYRMIATTDAPRREAQVFLGWVYRELLPTVRKHGTWPAPTDSTPFGTAVVRPDRGRFDALERLIEFPK